MECRRGCGACCIAPSINSPIPGMPKGKPAGVPCAQLDRNYECRLFGNADRPLFCRSLQATEDMCGNDRKSALVLIYRLEELTKN